jgi:hypothetical protein
VKLELATFIVAAITCGCLITPAPSTSTLAEVTTSESQLTPTSTTIALETTSTTTTLVRSSGPFQITAFYNVSTGVVVLDVEGDLGKPYTVVVDYDVYSSLPLPLMSPDFNGEKLHLARLEASKPAHLTQQTSPSPSEIIAKDSRAQYCITTNLSTFKEGTQSFSTSQDCSFMTFQLIPAA